MRTIAIKSGVLAVLSHFYGLSKECPYAFLDEFCRYCDIQPVPAGSTSEDYRLKDIPFILKGNARVWLSRFQGLLQTCPNHKLGEREIYSIFYSGLTVDSKNDLNLAAQGDFSKTLFIQSKNILERLIEAKRSYETSRGQYRRGVVHAAEARSDEKLEARFEQIEKKLLEAVEKSRAPPPPVPTEKQYVPPPPPPEEHHYYYCEFPLKRSRKPKQNEENWGYRHQGPQSSNQGRQPNNQVVSYVPPHQRSNQYPNQQQYQQEHYGHSDYQQPNHVGGPPNQRYNRYPNEGQGDIIVPHHPTYAMREIQEAQKEQRAALDMLTKQLSQVAMSLGELRGNEGKIPATVQPPGRENINEVSLRSGRVYQSPSPPVMPPASMTGSSREEKGESSGASQAKGSEKGKAKVGGESSKENQGEEAEKVKPYPYRGMVTRKRYAMIDVANMFKEVEVKVPFLTALKMPTISKFIKDYLAGNVNEEGRLITEENVSAVIQRSDLPSKKTDPGMFTLPISIGDIQVEHAMCDLGASINVLPYSIYRKLGAAKLIFS
ncbi:uncharacterized protein LOC121776640 [Salvia splendens]|uniref:uncharacterized protein LOC121776640 n=1 Tax=Salvia splendens TaxID=180675 RepID=UPI001C26918E|nr:uncharacterized protein LOC121776640 [Salvia splendens]